MRFEDNEKVKDGFYSALVGAVLVAAFLLAQNSFARSWDFDRGPAAAVINSLQGNVQTYVVTKDPQDGCREKMLAGMVAGYVNILVETVDGIAGETKGEERRLASAEEKACLKRAVQRLMKEPPTKKGEKEEEFVDALNGIDKIFALGIREEEKKTKI